jgi:hypothetical protein
VLGPILSAEPFLEQAVAESLEHPYQPGRPLGGTRGTGSLAASRSGDGAGRFQCPGQPDCRPTLRRRSSETCFTPENCAIAGAAGRERPTPPVPAARPVTFTEADARPLPVRLRDSLARLLTPYL